MTFWLVYAGLFLLFIWDNLNPIPGVCNASSYFLMYYISQQLFKKEKNMYANKKNPKKLVSSWQIWMEPTLQTFFYPIVNLFVSTDEVICQQYQWQLCNSEGKLWYTKLLPLYKASFYEEQKQKHILENITV